MPAIVNYTLTFTSANMNAAGFTPTGNAGIYIGQQITGTGITNLTYITGYNTGSGSYTGNSSYTITNNGQNLALPTISGKQVFQVLKLC